MTWTNESGDETRMERRITPLNRWFFIRKTRSKIRAADKCIETNTAMINHYLSIEAGKMSAEQSADFDSCTEYINSAMMLKEKWSRLLLYLEENEVYSIEE